VCVCVCACLCLSRARSAEDICRFSLLSVFPTCFAGAEAPKSFLSLVSRWAGPGGLSLDQKKDKKRNSREKKNAFY